MAKSVTISIDTTSGSLCIESGALFLGEQAPITFSGYTLATGHTLRLTVFGRDKVTPLADNSTSASVLDLRYEALRKAFGCEKGAHSFYSVVNELDADGDFLQQVVASGMLPVEWSPEVFDEVSGIPATMRGADGTDGADGADGTDGKDGTNGTNGISPTIGTNGNWFVGTTDTGVKAQGPQGLQGIQGERGPAGAAGASSWEEITGKPSTFPPSAHQHTKSEITDFPTSMTPTAHASTHGVNGSDPVTPSAIGAAAASDLSSHTGDSTVHVTAQDKTAWNGKSVVSVSGTGTSTDVVKYITINGDEKKVGVDIDATKIVDGNTEIDADGSVYQQSATWTVTMLNGNYVAAGSEGEHKTPTAYFDTPTGKWRLAVQDDELSLNYSVYDSAGSEIRNIYKFYATGTASATSLSFLCDQQGATVFATAAATDATKTRVGGAAVVPGTNGPGVGSMLKMGVGGKLAAASSGTDYDAGGTASSAVSTHNSDGGAHSSLFGAKRDKTDNVCHEDEYSWMAFGVPSGTVLTGQPICDSGIGWLWGSDFYSNDPESSTSLTFKYMSTGVDAFTATKTIAATNNISFVTADKAVMAFDAVGGQTPTVNAGVANLSPLFSSGNTSLMDVVRYDSATAVGNRKVATYVVDSTTSAIALPSPTANEVTDLVVILDCRSVSTIPSGLEFTGNILWAGGTAIAPTAGKTMVYGFTCDGRTKVTVSGTDYLAYIGNGIAFG